MTGVLLGKSITVVAVGSTFSLALTSDGKAFAWGDGTSGQLGDGSTAVRLLPVAVDMTGVLAGKTISGLYGSGGAFSMAITSDGKGYTWGLNSNGQLGGTNNGPNTNKLDGTTTLRSSPVAVNMTGALLGKSLSMMTAGNTHTRLLLTDYSSHGDKTLTVNSVMAQQFKEQVQ